MALEWGGPKAWGEVLDDDDWTFLKRFLVSSGSLKALAESYGVSYPTLRARLDRLIAKVRAFEEPEARDALERQLRVMLAEGTIAPAAARRLLKAHLEAMGKAGHR
jgi:hypothetical protein